MELRTLLIDNYDSYTYNLFQLIAEVNGGAAALGCVLRWRSAVAAPLLPQCAAHPAAVWLGAPSSHQGVREPWLLPSRRPAALPTVLRNDEVGWPELEARIAAGEWHNVVISPGPGTPQRAADVGEPGAGAAESSRTGRWQGAGRAARVGGVHPFCFGAGACLTTHPGTWRPSAPQA